MSEILKIRVGRRRAIVIPKRVASRLGIEEGDTLLLTVEEDRIILKPLPNAVTLSLHGRKVARVTLEELEDESLKRQRRYVGEA